MSRNEQIFCRPESGRRTCQRTSGLEFVRLGIALACLCVLPISDPVISQAQVTTSITATTGAGDLGTTVTHAGNLYNITDGTRPGNGPNLFHSFGDFSVGGGDIANFLNNTGLQTSNIIGRVTGGNISNIYGTIQTTGFDVGGLPTNLFLVNPAGFVFGPNGSLNVTGSVSFTTAQYLRLFDGVNSANFYANPASDGLANSVLAVAPVVDFGFLSPAAYGFLTPPDPSATITVQGSALSVPSGQSISLVGGNVVIQGATLPDGTVQPAHLSAPNGTIQLASTTSPGEFDVATLQPLPNVDGATFTSFGSVSLALGSSIDVSGARTVFVKGGQLVLSVNDATLTTLTTSGSPAPQDTISLSQGSSIVTSNSGAEPGADVQITVGNLSLDGAGTTIITQTFGDGIGGNITANVGTLSLTNGAGISSSTSGAPSGGSGGDIQLTATNLILDGTGTTITTQTSAGTGNAGHITANVGALSLTNGATISSTNSSSGIDLTGDGVADAFGGGGDITVQGLLGTNSPAESVTLSNGAQITTFTFGPGRGGDVDITARSLKLESASGIISETDFGDGKGGDLLLNVGTLRLIGGPLGPSEVRSTNFNFGTDPNFDGILDRTGAGGAVTILGISHEPGSVAESVDLSGGSQIASITVVSGDGGGVTIAANSLTMSGVSEFGVPTSINSFTFGTGLGGNIVVGVQTLNLSAGAQIISDTESFDPAGAPGGSVTVQGLGQGQKPKAESVTFSGEGSGILSETQGQARLGDITVYAGNLTLESGAVINAGTTASTGSSGNVTIEANSVVVSSGSLISSQALAADALAVTITADELTLNQGRITSSTTGAFNAGTITANVGALTLTNNAEISSNSTGQAAGNAGSLTIQGLGGPGTSATSVTLTNSSLLTNAEGTGAGGDITVAAGSFTLNNASTVSAATAGPQNAGAITITTTGNPVSLASGSSITSSTTGAGDAGQVIVTTPTLNVDNATITTSTSSSGNAGSITANVGTLTLTNAAEISSSSTGAASGNAGSITIQGLASPADTVSVTDSSILTRAEGTGAGGSIGITATTLTLDHATISAAVTDVPEGGDPTAGLGSIALAAPTFQMTGGSVTAETAGSRNAGNIVLLASTFSAGGGSQITSSTSAAGDAGQVIVTTPTLSLDNATITTSTSSSGNAGSITANVGTLNLTNAGTISSNSTGTAPGSGNAGTVTIQGLTSPANSVTITDSSVTTSTAGPGQGGAITMKAATINLSNGTISASTAGTGNAGNITIQSGSNVVMNNSSITTEATRASGGQIEVDAPGMVRLINSRISTSVHDGTGGGGNITIEPQFVILQNSQIIAQAFAGSGGEIHVITDVFIADPNSVVSASSLLGPQGTVNIQSPVQNVGGNLTPLSQQFSSAAALLAQQCAARAADGKFSTFVVAGREGLPVEPGGFLASPSLTAELLGSNLSGRDRHTQFSAVTSLFPEYDARPIQLAMFGDACHQ